MFKIKGTTMFKLIFTTATALLSQVSQAQQPLIDCVIVNATPYPELCLGAVTAALCNQLGGTILEDSCVNSGYYEPTQPDNDAGWPGSYYNPYRVRGRCDNGTNCVENVTITDCRAFSGTFTPGGTCPGGGMPAPAPMPVPAPMPAPAPAPLPSP